MRAIERGGLAVWRLTVDRASLEERLDLVERAGAVQRARSSGIRAFAPLPRQDPADQPATGYDDVRTIAVARLVCATIPFIQVDWPLYGPKLAQVALMYGANDVDGVARGRHARTWVPADRRSRTSAGRFAQPQGMPVERNGRYERLS